MHNESQVQDRDWGDVTTSSDSKGRSVYRCKRCHKRFWNLDKASDHIECCKIKYDQLPKGIDFVVCNVCGWHAKKLGAHLKNEHGINSADYDGQIVCESSKKKYESVAKENGNWIERAKENGEDLSDYKQKMGQAVKESILSNPSERKRRASVMGAVNKTDLMRKKSSETAIKTSARKDIQEKRSAQLKKWRDENPDDFYNKCIKKMIETYNSKPEALLFKIVSEIDGYSFKRSQFMKSNTFISKTKRKQVDIADKSKRVYVEFDGKLHFKNTKFDQLEINKLKDKLLDEHIIKHRWILIRVSYDQFSYRKSDYGFKKDCLDKVFEILNNPTPGVYKIGESYV